MLGLADPLEKETRERAEERVARPRRARARRPADPPLELLDDVLADGVDLHLGLERDGRAHRQLGAGCHDEPLGLGASPEHPLHGQRLVDAAVARARDLDSVVLVPDEPRDAARLRRGRYRVLHAGAMHGRGEDDRRRQAAAQLLADVRGDHVPKHEGGRDAGLFRVPGKLHVSRRRPLLLLGLRAACREEERGENAERGSSP